jgi:hypothetical protein
MQSGRIKNNIITENAMGKEVKTRQQQRDDKSTVIKGTPLFFKLPWRILPFFIFLLGSWLAPLNVWGQAANIQLEVDKHIVGVGEEMQATVQIEVAGRSGYDRYLPPSFTGFRVASGGMTTQNIEMINWQVKRHESYVYTISPLNEGTFSIGPAVIIVGGRTIKSNTVQVKVRKGTLSAPSNVPAPNVPAPNGMPDPDNQESSVFISAVASSQKVYQGQQVIVVWSLYTQSDVLGFQTLKQPTTDGFWSEELRSPQRLEFEQKVIGDRVYYAAVLARKALFPQKPGKLLVGAMQAQLRVLEGFSSARMSIESPELTIEVLSLPTKGQPNNFPQENVGQFESWASLDRTAIKAGDAVTLKIVVRGAGNLSYLKLPPLENLEGFKVYEPKISDKLELEDGVSGEKTWEYLLLPTRSGQLHIPAIHLPFFDPQSGTYKKASTSPLSLTVNGVMPATNDGSLDNKSESKQNRLGLTIRPPRPNATIVNRSTYSIHRSVLFWALCIFPLMVLLGVSGGERLYLHFSRETPRSVRRAAARRLQAHLKRAQEFRRQRDRQEFFSEIAMALRVQLDQQMQMRTEGLTREELRLSMYRRGFPEDLIEETFNELDNCDFARFAPAASSEQQMDESLARISTLLNRLERCPLQREEA